ncbi:MAG: glycosyltransferase [Lachnospiraceae bacterium]|nr:glycosyltransferase [Lachnospiraceae bacterium]
MGIKKDEFLVGHVGRYHVQKNHEMIVAVFCELLKTKPNARLLLVGGSGKKEEIVRMISQAGITDKVIMLENRADVPALMKAMDVFLFPSKWEGFGNVLIEAQSIGVRCVVSDKVPESVRLTELVTVCDLREPLQVWVDAILNKKNHVTPTGSLNDYDMKNCAKKLQKIYLEEE